MKKFFTIFLIVFISNVKAQIVGTNAYLKGNSVELGVSGCGTLGTRRSVTEPIPLIYHRNSNTFRLYGLGLVADQGRNGWSVSGPNSVPNFCGDYFLPLNPFEGFAVQLGMNTYANYNWNSGICGEKQISGNIINYISNSFGKYVIWQTDSLIDGKIKLTSTFFIPDTGLAVIAKIEICNESATSINDIYYSRFWDPDNDVPWPGGVIQTYNKILAQGNISGHSILTSNSLLGCLLGISSSDSRSRVAKNNFYMLPTNAADVYNTPNSSYSGDIGVETFEDLPVSICFHIPSLAAGECTCLNYGYFFDLADSIRSMNYNYPIIGCNYIPDSTNINIVQGRTYYDINHNCIFEDSIDSPASFQNIRNASGSLLGMSDINGNYSVITQDTGWVSLNVYSTITFNTVCPDSGVYNFYNDTLNDLFLNINFGDTTILCPKPILNLNSIGIHSCLNDSLNYLQITISNPSHLKQFIDNILLHLDDSVSIDSSFLLPYTYSGFNTFLINIADTINSYSVITFHIPLSLGCDTVGSIYNFNASINGVNSCDTFIIQSFNSFAIQSSNLINSKQVRRYNRQEVFQNENSIDSLCQLEYIIQFRNNTNSTIRNIRINDVLDYHFLDINSLIVTGYSHPYSLILVGNDLNFYFNNINLPNGSVYDPLTYGYVSFKINQLGGNILGTEIYNTAEIYFDTNAVIYSNQCMSIIDSITNKCTFNHSVLIDTLLCENDSNAKITIIPRTNSLYTYLWNNGSIDSTINHLSTGAYTVTITNSYDFGCSRIDTIFIKNANAVFSRIQTRSDLILCGNNNNGYITLRGSDTLENFHYLWSTNDTTNSISNLGTGNYSVKVCDINGCCDSNYYVVNSTPAPNLMFTVDNDTICMNDTLLLEVSGADLYEWLYNNSFSDFIITSIDSTTIFKVIGYNFNGCTDSNEIIIYVKNCTIGIDETKVSNFIIYPVPSSGIINIICDETIQNIEIISSDGKLIRNINDVNKNSLDIDLTGLAKGFYFVKSYTAKLVYNKKIIIN